MTGTHQGRCRGSWWLLSAGPVRELCGVPAGQGLIQVPHDQGVEGVVREEETLDHWHVGSARCNPWSSVGARAMASLLCWALSHL